MQRASKTYNPLTGGLYSDSSPFTYPEGSTSDELNCTVTHQGGRTIRQGLSQEPGGVWYPMDIGYTNRVISVGSWDNVAEQGGTSFVVVQTGNILHFYESNKPSISSNKKWFTLDLNAHKIPTVTSIEERCEFSDNNGVLFVACNHINTIYIVYNPNTDSISATEVVIKMRDLEGIPNDYEPDFEPDVLTDEHKYNLKNNGWIRSTRGNAFLNNPSRDPIIHYNNRIGVYPPLSKQWWTTQDPLADDWMTTKRLAQFPTGNSWAPKGHYILDAFNQDRAGVSEIPSIPTTVINKRPRTITSFAGRMWYSEGDKIYFSQIIRRDLFRAGWCYQEADPTAKDINALVDTDGGVVSILEAETIMRLKPYGRSLFVFASNGCWEITGSVGQGFKPTDYSIRQIATYTTVGPEVVDCRDGLHWITNEGIQVIQLNGKVDQYVVTPLTENRLTTFYTDIPNKETMAGAYDYLDKKAYWLYSTYQGEVEGPNTLTPRYKYDSLLVFSNQFKGFYPWKINPGGTTWIGGIIPQATKIGITSIDIVLDGFGAPVLDGSNETVYIESDRAFDTQTVVKFLLVRELNNSFDLSFGYFYDSSLKDFTFNDYNAYIESGFIIEGAVENWKQMPYIYFFFKQDQYNSDCLFRTKWNSANSEDVVSWSKPYSVYNNPGQFFDMAVSRHRVRGKGRVMKIRLDKSMNTNFTLWAMATIQDSTKGP